MAHRKRSLCFSALAVTLVTLSCTPTQPLTATPTSTFAPAPSQTPPPTPTSTRSAIEPPASIDPFQRVASLPESLSVLSEEIQVRGVPDGSVWVITSESIFRWDAQEWKQVQSIEEGMQADVDGNGQLWLFRQDPPESATWKEGQWLTYGPESGWTSVPHMPGWAPKPWTLLTAADGTLWLSTNWDVRSFDGQRWTIYGREAMGFPALGEENEGIQLDHQIALVNDGAQVWVGECQIGGPGPISSSGIRWFDGITWQGADAPAGPVCISAIDIDPAGNVWMGTLSTLWQYEPARQRWKSYSLPETALKSYKFAYPLELLADHSDSIWVYLEYCGGASCGVDYGLLHMQAEEWSEVSGAQAWFLPPQMFAEGSGQSWLLGGGTLYRLEAAALKPVTSSVVHSVDLNPDGKLWAVVEEENGAALWVLEP